MTSGGASLASDATALASRSGRSQTSIVTGPICSRLSGRAAYDASIVADPFLEWLCSADLTDPSGHCLSWWNRRRPGYAYPEISGLLLTLLALTGTHSERRRGLVAALHETPGGSRGIGRFGTDYTFDAGMALRGLLRSAKSADDRERDLPACETFIDAVLDRRATTEAVAVEPDTRWSLSFGAHQAKVAGALVECLRVDGLRDRATEALTQLRKDTLALQDDDGRFRIHGASSQTYAHSHCYAVEGLLMMADAGFGGHDDEIRLGAEWLSTAQAPDGSVRAWHDGVRANGPERLDASAQAVRIFRIVDGEQFGAEIDAGNAFLRRHVVGDRAVPYEPGSDDLNAWCTMFAAQALAPATHAAAARSGASLV